MRVIGCSGFPVPATKYLREFNLVEVSDTAIGVPGPALVRRWRREAPDGFVFTALAPREMTASAFEPTAEGEAAWASFLPIVRDLAATAIVLTSPAELAVSKKARASARTMLERLTVDAPAPIVWEAPPEWPLKEAEAAAKDLPVIIARDPLKHPPVQKAPVAYYRLPGPAGFKSRYEDASIDAIAQALRETHADTVLCVMANQDMYSDAKRLRAIIE
jgi:uncharacterized protein YecE (DUF72 family)